MQYENDEMSKGKDGAFRQNLVRVARSEGEGKRERGGVALLIMGKMAQED